MPRENLADINETNDENLSLETNDGLFDAWMGSAVDLSLLFPGLKFYRVPGYTIAER